MFGWNGKFLRINLTKGTSATETYSTDFASDYFGGRGFAVRILWDTLRPKTDSLSAENPLIFAVGPLTGYPLPNSGKLIVAAKSPLTGGYGDGNLGTWAAVHMRRAGYDAFIVEGKANKPTVLHVKDDAVEFLDGSDLWGSNSFETEAKLKQVYGRAAGIVSIGQGGENLVKFACVVSQEGRAGGRPGMGAVMGSKNLKAIVIEGTKTIPTAHLKKLKQAGRAGYQEILTKPNYKFWKRVGTLGTVDWANINSALPTRNYQEGTFADAEKINGFAAEAIKVSNRGCPNCNMTCGNVVKDAAECDSELDYENVAMLGSNIGLGNIAQVSELNRIADEFGLDTISLGSTIGFAMETCEKGLIKEKYSWGNFEEAKALCRDITYRRGIGDVLAEGVRAAAAKIGGGSGDWAMHVKGLEVSAYDCRAAPGMALAYGTSPIGAHHKAAWVLAWEAQNDRLGYGEEKAAHLVATQNARGIFECLGVCRFAMINLGLDREWYPKYLTFATGQKYTWDDFNRVSERVFNLMRAFWIREHNGAWSSEMDVPPARWFNEPLTEGPLKGAKLDRQKYNTLLQSYYRKRGWDENGVPTKETLEKLRLSIVAQQLNL
ncbi:MAG: aldehyde ferredoxin oxidoreductase family protein [Candidatus Bathyarchaeota archaeon]|nr:aldehyde ferredoxin oxidoreductase family protein [Candidatus Bathyarchaeota archaeon]